MMAHTCNSALGRQKQEDCGEDRGLVSVNTDDTVCLVITLEGKAVSWYILLSIIGIGNFCVLISFSFFSLKVISKKWWIA